MSWVVGSLFVDADEARREARKDRDEHCTTLLPVGGLDRIDAGNRWPLFIIMKLERKERRMKVP